MNRSERRRRHKSSRVENKSVSLLSTAVKHLSEGRLNRAKQLLQGQLKKTPTDVSCMHYLGVALYQLGDFNQAREVLERTVQNAPKYAQAHNSLGNLLFETGQVFEAAESFRLAISSEPNYANAYTNLGEALRQIGELESAENYLRQAMPLDPSSIKPIYILGSVLIGRGKPVEALKFIKEALEIEPYCQNALAAKGIALQMLGKETEARKLQCFDTYVYSLTLDIPTELGSKEQFNADLSNAIRNDPTLIWEPLNRVTRNGAVTQDMLKKPSREIRKFEQALRQSIDQFMDGLSFESNHPFLGCIPKNYSLTFVASILREGGWHPSHIHESAWLSGVYYVDVPPIPSSNCINNVPSEKNIKNEGWLEFGKPNYDIQSDAELFYASYPPEIGVARCFPSYFFHNTIPFTGSGDRIGIAFDVFAVHS